MIPLWVWIIVAILVCAVLWVISTSNRFKVLLVKIEEADSGVDMALTKRYDTLTKLMDVVRAYARHEIDAPSEFVRLRADMNHAQKAEVNRQLDVLTDRVRIIAEAYPALRSSENYRVLQDAVLDAEDHLQAARRVYNMNVSAFNQAIVQFPASIIATRALSGPKGFFAAEDEKKQDASMK